MIVLFLYLPGITLPENCWANLLHTTIFHHQIYNFHLQHRILIYIRKNILQVLSGTCRNSICPMPVKYKLSELKGLSCRYPYKSAYKRWNTHGNLNTCSWDSPFSALFLLTASAPLSVSSLHPGNIPTTAISWHQGGACFWNQTFSHMSAIWTKMYSGVMNTLQQ